MFDYFVYLLYRVEAAALTALPLRVLYAVGNGAGFFGWLLFGRYRRLARQNATIAFGQEKSPRQLRRLVRQHFQRLCANLLCSIKLANMPVDEILQHVKVENIEAMDRQLKLAAGKERITLGLAPALLDLIARRGRKRLKKRGIVSQG